MTILKFFCTLVTTISICLILLGMTISYGQTTSYDSVICDEPCISEFRTPDFEKPFAIITFNKESYTWASKVKVTIFAPSWNADKDKIDIIGEDEEHPIRISTRGHSIKPYSFVELSPNSGKFYGEFKLTGFVHDADGDGSSDLTPKTGGSGPKGGKLECDRDDAVTVSFEAADGVVLVASAPINWNLGDVKFDLSSYGGLTQATITVTDNDMNLSGIKLDTVEVEVYSDSDGTGITATAVETGSKTGIFEANIAFTQNKGSSGERLRVSEGDIIHAKYVDRTVPKPFSKNDEIDIVAKSFFGYFVLPTDKIIQQNLRLSDFDGNILNPAEVGQQVLIQSDLIFNMKRNFQFTHILQIIDENELIVYLSWQTSSSSEGQSITVTQPWIPQHEGDYMITTFVWDSLSNANPLAEAENLRFTIR